MGSRMKRTLILFVWVLSCCGCASDPGSVDYGAFAVISSDELPAKVFQAVEGLGDLGEVTEIKKYYQYDDWFEIKFSNGESRKFNSNGEQLHFGTL